MDIFNTLEKKIDKLVAAYRELQEKVATLEQENKHLKASGNDSTALSKRVAELEAERTEVRERLDRVVKNLASLEL
jgi:FtsZ-binding cell division protein ZapB